MRRFLSLIAVTCILAFSLAALPGCGDDVKKVKKVETHKESQPEPVSPGEMIVE